ncbi:serine/threonine-protein kinase [Gemmata massiliana]|uniref:serine/threonine-protein kinase n=1 Tax=Gemmata massiliana TaxID=1210884 RepID=UPI0013A7019B|nr:serine/threonine-protein kinase [Gemmata massiliana]
MILPESGDGCSVCAKTRRVDPRAETDVPEITEPRARVRSTPPAPEVLPPNPPGLVLSHLLGRGGVGAVYLARDVETKRQVAVKLLHVPGDSGAVGRLQVEVETLASLTHPNVVTVFAAKLQQNPPHYTMEFASPGTLSRFVAARGPLAPRDAAKLIQDVAHGTHAANQAQIIHRDIKPGNVLLQFKNGTADSSAPVDLATLQLADVEPKLSDFGLAKQLDRTVSFTQNTGVLGTPGFMAPEQVTGASVVEAAADVYGLGATLYYALTGQAPFEEPELHKIVGQIEHVEPTRIRIVRPEISVDLEAIVHKCLEKEPSARYATAEELAADLGRFLEGKPVLAKPLTPLRRARKAVLRNRGSLAGAALLVCALVGVFALGISLSTWPPVAGAPLPPSPDSIEYIEAQLAARQPVTLVKDSGKPVWHKWVLDSAEFVPDKANAPCAFSTRDLSMLDLCRDTMVDRYRIRAELSQADVIRTPDGRTRDPGGHEIGLYFGRQTALGDNDWRSQVAFLIKFTEFSRPTPPGFPPPGQEAARLVHVCVPKSPTVSPLPRYMGSASVPFTQANQTPGPWRTIEVDVTPAGIAARWIRPDNTEAQFRPLPIAEVQTKYSKPHEELNNLIPDNGIKYPAWNARGAIGVWGYRSVVAVRNVTLTPLP